MAMKSAMNLLLLVLVILCSHFSLAEEQRIVTQEELSARTGNFNGDIWLSIMGEVYDVTSGRSFYGPGGNYAVFAGKDGSVPFITGKFTQEEAQKSLTESLSAAQLVALEGWRKFYETSDKYPFVGLLQGSLYDEHGNPTEELKTVREMIENYEPPPKKKRETTSSEL
jgi:predicted heme/steroid binding protein